MSVFNRLLVGTLPLVPRFIVGRVAARYVAGATLGDALRVVAELNRQEAMATIDLLGEEVSERDKALAAVEEYLRVFAAIQERGLDSNVSIKLTLLGLKIDEGFCRDNVDRVAAAARVRASFVRGLEKLIEHGIYPAIATHDEYLSGAATALIDKHGLRREQYEFQ